jgi:ABC-2 type transport system permease protein
MNKNRVLAILIRNLTLWKRDIDRVFDTFWWSFFDVVIWGIMSDYFTKSGGGQTTVFIMMAIILWAVVARTQWEISSTMIIESWDKNLINIFTTPIKISEFIFASAILGLGKVFLTVGFMGTVAWLFFRFNILTFSWWLLPLTGSLFLTAVWLAILINSLILRFGKNVVTFAWTLSMLLYPVSGVVFPISVLPRGLQFIARFIPSSYIFEGMRSILFTGQMDIKALVISFGLNILYIVLACWIFIKTFKQARIHGWLIKLV